VRWLIQKNSFFFNLATPDFFIRKSSYEINKEVSEKWFGNIIIDA
jgi:hypothetical protein